MTGKNTLGEEYRRSSKRRIAFILVTLVLTLAVSLYSICVSKYSIGFGEACNIIMNHFNGIVPVSYEDRLKDYLVWDKFIPRAIVGVLVGAILAIGGAVMQTIVKNPLTDSYTTGISSGALFGVTIFIILGFSIFPGITGNPGMILNAFVFALIPATVIILFSAFRKVTPTIMVLIGIAIMYIFTATVTLLKYTCSDENLVTIYEWTVGTLGKSVWDFVPYLICAFAIIFTVMMLQSKNLNVLSSSDRSAMSLGVNPTRVRIICILTISVSTAIAVCFTGTIGFVGLVCPHIGRMLVGSNLRYLIPSSAVIGALMMIAADCLARSVGATGLPVGVITALVGGPVFLFFLIKQRKSIWN